MKRNTYNYDDFSPDELICSLKEAEDKIELLEKEIDYKNQIIERLGNVCSTGKSS